MNRWFFPSVIAVSVLMIAVSYRHTHRRVPIPPGPVALAEPLIQPISDKASWTYKGFTIQPMASCRLRARVLSTERYYWDKGSKVSPVDLAVGWRGMSDSLYLNQLRVTQGSRWYFFHYDEPVLPNEVISEQSKNIHVIPATKDIARKAKRVRKDQVVRAHGSLVKVTGPGDFTWISSLGTGGSGEGSCWLFWIDTLEIEDPLVVRLGLKVSGTPK